SESGIGRHASLDGRTSDVAGEQKGQRRADDGANEDRRGSRRDAEDRTRRKCKKGPRDGRNGRHSVYGDEPDHPPRPLPGHPLRSPGKIYAAESGGRHEESREQEEQDYSAW